MQTTEQETTTNSSSPPKCSDENIDERVCDVEDEIKELISQNIVFAAAIERLENKFNELTNCTCTSS